MKKVEFVEEKVALGTTMYYEGDVKSFEDEVADMLIQAGWAKDVNTGECGVRVPGAAPLNIQSTKQVLGSA